MKRATIFSPSLPYWGMTCGPKTSESEIEEKEAETRKTQTEAVTCTIQIRTRELGGEMRLKFIYDVKLGKRFGHIVADKLAIKQKDVIAYRKNTIILTTKLDLLEKHIRDRIAQTLETP